MTAARRREYLQFLDSAKSAILLSIDCFNRVQTPYRNEGSLILLTNAWELLAKALLLKRKVPISKTRRGESLSAQHVVLKLQDLGILERARAETIQQIISLRNEASHGVLPSIESDVMHHLLFYGCKFFKDAVKDNFPRHVLGLETNFLSLSFANQTTYADRVQKAISSARRSPEGSRLVWLLERGVAFDGRYLTENQVAAKYRNTKKIVPHLRLGEHLKSVDMVRVIPIEAPKNFTADITLRRGSPSNSSLPVVVRRSDVDIDYPYLTKDLSARVGKNVSWIAKALSVEGLKGDLRYHQSIRTSKDGQVHRYSEAALQRLLQLLQKNPDFSPFKR